MFELPKNTYRMMIAFCVVGVVSVGVAVPVAVIAAVWWLSRHVQVVL